MSSTMRHQNVIVHQGNDIGHILGQLREIVEHLLDGIRRQLDIVATSSICHAKFTILMCP